MTAASGVHLGCGASGPEDFTLADRNAVRPGDQEGAQALLLAREPPGVIPVPAGGMAGLQGAEISLPALLDLHSGTIRQGPSIYGMEGPCRDPAAPVRPVAQPARRRLPPRQGQAPARFSGFPANLASPEFPPSGARFRR